MTESRESYADQRPPAPDADLAALRAERTDLQQRITDLEKHLGEPYRHIDRMDSIIHRLRAARRRTAGRLWKSRGLRWLWRGAYERFFAKVLAERAAHRAAVEALPCPVKLWALAAWIDIKYPDEANPEVQRDLRAWARKIMAFKRPEVDIEAFCAEIADGSGVCTCGDGRHGEIDEPSAAAPRDQRRGSCPSCKYQYFAGHAENCAPPRRRGAGQGRDQCWVTRPCVFCREHGRITARIASWWLRGRGQPMGESPPECCICRQPITEIVMIGAVDGDVRKSAHCRCWDARENDVLRRQVEAGERLAAALEAVLAEFQWLDGKGRELANEMPVMKTLLEEYDAYRAAAESES